MPRPVKSTVKLSIHAVNGAFAGYKRMIGGIRFFFGTTYMVECEKDRPRAETAATILELEWKRLKSMGATSWGAADLDRARKMAIAYATGATTAPSTPSTTTPLPVQVVQQPMPWMPNATHYSPMQAFSAPPMPQQASRPSMSLHAAIDAYLADRKLDVGASRIGGTKIGHDTLVSLEQRLSYVKAATTDMPLSAMGKPQVETIVNHFLSRPKSVATGRPISPRWVSHMVMAFGQMMRWAYYAEHWDAYRNWEAAFRVHVDDLYTDKEKRQQRNEKPTFTIDELAILYSNAPIRTRLYMLMALNAGHGAKEQATLDKSDIIGNRIERYRHKTHVDGRWTLWPETQALLALAIKRQLNVTPQGLSISKWRNITPPKEAADLAIVTDTGMPLVHTAGHKKTDSVALSWKRLMGKKSIKEAIKHGQVRPLNFYALRRTAAQWVRNAQGYEAHKIYLAHASLEADGRRSVSEKHYSVRTEAEYAKVDLATNAIRNDLAPMFSAAKALDAAKCSTTILQTKEGFGRIGRRLAVALELANNEALKERNA